MLSGRKILITGGGSGIGAATAAIVRERGACAYVIGHREPIPKEDKRDYSLADVTDPAQVDRAVVEAAQRMGGIDGLANIAGVGGGQRLDATDLDRWNQIIAVNLTGTFLVTRAALSFLKIAPEASIVNISSAVALHASAGTGAYAAAKRGIISLSQTWAIELAPKIRVNVVCPGAVDTPMLRKRNLVKSADPITGERYALGRIARPEEIATAIAFLLGSDSSFVTGIVLPADGGRTYY